MPEGTSEAPLIRVLVADEIATIVTELEQLPERAGDIVLCGAARREIDIAAEAAAQQPTVLLLREGFTTSDAATVAERVHLVSPATRVVLLRSATHSTDATMPGVAAMAPSDASIDNLIAIIRSVAQPTPAELSAPVRGALQAANGHLPEAEADAEPIADVPRRRARRAGRTRGEIILVFAGKGGVGKSMVATNLAVALAGQTEGKVALVDLNLQYGDVGVMLHVEHHPMAIEDLTQQGEEVEGEFLDQVMALGPADVRVLLAPSSPEYADLVTAPNLRAIFRELGRAYDYVVVDSVSYLEERVLETIELANAVVLVTAFNITSVKNTKVTLNLFRALGVPADKVAVVLNQNRPRVSFTREEIEEILRVRVLAEIPYDSRVDEAIDGGRPIVQSEPRSDLARQLHRVVDYLAGEQEADEPAEPQRQRAPRTARRRFSLGRR